jgi:hypothetical protein
MSYDIYLYDRAFLNEAIKQDLGDWVNAAPIAPEVLKIVREELLRWG